MSKDYIMINEDGTGSSRPVMAAKGRDGSGLGLAICKAIVDAEGGRIDVASEVGWAQPSR